MHARSGEISQSTFARGSVANKLAVRAHASLQAGDGVHRKIDFSLARSLVRSLYGTRVISHFQYVVDWSNGCCRVRNFVNLHFQ